MASSLGDRALCGSTPGSSFDVVVVHVTESIYKGLWNGDLFSCPNLGPGTWTLLGYTLVAIEHNVGVLRETPLSQAFLRPLRDQSSFSTLVEVCSGIGGISEGARFAGLETLLSVDKAEIACKTVSLNGGRANSRRYWNMGGTDANLGRLQRSRAHACC